MSAVKRGRVWIEEAPSTPYRPNHGTLPAVPVGHMTPVLTQNLGDIGRYRDGRSGRFRVKK